MVQFELLRSQTPVCIHEIVKCNDVYITVPIDGHSYVAVSPFISRKVHFLSHGRW